MECTVCDTIMDGGKKNTTITINPDTQVSTLFNNIASEYEYNAEDIELVIQNRDRNSVSCLFYI